MHIHNHRLVSIALVTVLSGCGGSSMTSDPMQYPGPTGPPQYPEPTGPTRVTLPERNHTHAMHAPISALAGKLHVGPDIAPAPSALTRLADHDNTRIYAGPVRDSTPVSEMLSYLEMTAQSPQQISLRTSETPAVVMITAGAQAELRPYVARAVQLVNVTLPRAARMTMIAEPGPTYDDPEVFTPGRIPIGYGPGTEIGGVAYYGTADGRRTYAYILITRPTYEAVVNATNERDRHEATDQLMAILVHELLHAIGAENHQDTTIHPNTLMGTSARINPEHVLFPIDRDVLAASHTVIRPVGTREEVAMDLGAWNET